MSVKIQNLARLIGFGLCLGLIAQYSNAEEPVLEGELLRQERLGYYYFSRGDVFGALQNLLPVAESGHALSQYRLGTLEEAATNYEEAARWYGLAVEQHVVEANRALASMYANGLLGAVDLEKAYSLQLIAAERGLVPSMFYIANALENGIGVDKNREQAIAWYQKAADAGNVSALQRLQRAYGVGELGMPVDLAKSKDLGARAQAAGEALRLANEALRKEAFAEFRLIEQRYLNGQR